MSKMMIILTSLMLILMGCKEKEDIIQDLSTKNEIKFVKPFKGTIIISVNDDWMLGKVGYSHSQLVVDPNVYRENDIQRGDVVYYISPPYKSHIKLGEKRVLRVIGLSGERIRLKKGQFYINDKRLDSFYGKDIYNDSKMLKKELKKSDLEDYEVENLKNRLHNVENENMNEILIPEDSLFLVGDNRGRAYDSKLLGPIPTTNVIGKVIGMVKE